MKKRNLATVLGWTLALVALVAMPVAGEDVILRGVDTWSTPGGGTTFTSFAEDPIPADFFCLGSPAFSGKIQLRGNPLATAPAEALTGVDTILMRLDDASFDSEGRATTRLRFLALSLVSPEPVDFGCEQPFAVAVSLDGEQPTTEMQIVREGEQGGTYIAPLALHVKVAFTPVGTDEASRTVSHRIDLGPGTHTAWSYQDPTAVRQGRVRVDTDGDGAPDTVLPGPSNFAVGVAPAASGSEIGIDPNRDPCAPENQACHCDPTSTNPDEPNELCVHLHCVNRYNPSITCSYTPGTQTTL